MVLVRILSDALTLTDAITVYHIHARTVYDSLTLTDAILRDGVFTRSPYDPLTLTERLAASVNDAPLVLDNLKHWRWWYWRTIRRSEKPSDLPDSELWG